MQELAVQLLTDICVGAVPVSVVFALGELIISSFMRVAFGGKLWLGK